jgi:hypothetical protein
MCHLFLTADDVIVEKAKDLPVAIHNAILGTHLTSQTFPFHFPGDTSNPVRCSRPT